MPERPGNWLQRYLALRGTQAMGRAMRPGRHHGFGVAPSYAAVPFGAQRKGVISPILSNIAIHRDIQREGDDDPKSDEAAEAQRQFRQQMREQIGLDRPWRPVSHTFAGARRAVPTAAAMGALGTVAGGLGGPMMGVDRGTAAMGLGALGLASPLVMGAGRGFFGSLLPRAGDEETLDWALHGLRRRGGSIGLPGGSAIGAMALRGVDETDRIMDEPPEEDEEREDEDRPRKAASAALDFFMRAG